VRVNDWVQLKTFWAAHCSNAGYSFVICSFYIGCR